MEKLIESWEWKEHIEENLNRIIAEKPMSKECKEIFLLKKFLMIKSGEHLRLSTKLNKSKTEERNS